MLQLVETSSSSFSAKFRELYFAGHLGLMTAVLPVIGQILWELRRYHILL
jgi:hypothetical protein